MSSPLTAPSQHQKIIMTTSGSRTCKERPARTAAAGLVVKGRSVLRVSWLRLLRKNSVRPVPIASPTSHPTKSMAKIDEETLALPITVLLPEQR